MLRAAIIATVNACTRYAWSVIAVGVLLGVLSGVYSARHLAINTDINTLISPKLDWRKREIARWRDRGRGPDALAVELC